MPKKPWKILVVDDDLTMIRMLEKRLMNDGKAVTVASDGRLAYQKAVDEQPDLIILDIVLPDANGKDIARQIRKDPATQHIPIIFITITMDVEQDKGNETIDIDGESFRVFAKPLHNPKILSVIRKEINRSQNNS